MLSLSEVCKTSLLTEMKKYRMKGQSNRIKINDLSVKRLPKPLWVSAAESWF